MLALVSKKYSESAELCCVCGCISGPAVWVRFSLLSNHTHTQAFGDEDCGSTGVCLNGFSPLPPLSPLLQIHPIFHPRFFFSSPLTFSPLLYLCTSVSGHLPLLATLIHLLISSAVVLVSVSVMPSPSPSPSRNSHTADHVCVLYNKN